MTTFKKGIVFALISATLYAISTPLSKILLDHMPSTMLAGFLYLGAGIGMFAVFAIGKIANKNQKEISLNKNEMPYIITMVVLDIIAPICLMFGLKLTSAASVSLLNNFEIVATAIIARCFFKEKISKDLFNGIVLITLACMLLTYDGNISLDITYGAIFVIFACICWGFENNCTRKLSSKDPNQIVIIKGIFSGFGSIIVGLAIGERINAIWSVFAVLAIGFVAYGLSIFFYVHAQRILGAARTSAFYAITPFVGTILSSIIFGVQPTLNYLIAFILMLIGSFLSSKEERRLPYIDI